MFQINDIVRVQFQDPTRTEPYLIGRIINVFEIVGQETKYDVSVFIPSINSLATLQFITESNLEFDTEKFRPADEISFTLKPGVETTGYVVETIGPMFNGAWMYTVVTELSNGDAQSNVTITDITEALVTSTRKS